MPLKPLPKQLRKLFKVKVAEPNGFWELKGIKTMLEKLMTDYGNWLKIGENMSKKPVSYFTSEEARGQYSGYLRTKAWFETRIANFMDLENENGCFPVEVKAKYY